MDTNDQWIRDRVGHPEPAHRRSGGRSWSISPRRAGALAVKDAGLDPTDIDTVIVASCTMPNPIPNAAAQTAYRIGMSAPAAFDLNAACAGFCYAMGTAADLVRAGSAAARPGDRRREAVGLAGLGRPLHRDHLRRRGGRHRGRSRGADETRSASGRWPGAARATWRTPSRSATTGRSRRAAASTRRARPYSGGPPRRSRRSRCGPIELAGLTPADIDVFVPHQANLRIVEAVAQRLRNKGARQDMVVADDIVHSGNTSSASIPMALDHMRAAGRARSGDVGTARRLRRGPLLRGPGRRPSLRSVNRPRQEGETTVADNAEILAGLSEIVEEVAGIETAEVTADKTFVDDLDIDSLSMVEIAVQAEDKFGVKIPDDQLAELKTVGDAVDYIATHQ